MNETQRNIKALKAALPGLKERVLAVALLLVMSAAMMTSATFAWITLSRAPEVSNVTTNIAANGNLEIALVKPDGSQPGESAVGDSSAADGRNIVDANLTWGNLINLSDASYGLDKIVLRPALLGNTEDLVNQPLKGVDYGVDGRLEQYFNEDYQFANFIINKDGSTMFKYNNPQQYGVRAVSTIAYDFVEGDFNYEFSKLLVKPTSMQALVVEEYLTMINDSDNLGVLSNLISLYLDDRMNGDGLGNVSASAYVPAAYNLAMEFREIVDHFGDALMELANVQIFSFFQGEPEYENYIYQTKEEFFADKSNWASKGIQIDCIDEYEAILKKLDEVIYGKDPNAMDCMFDFNAYLDPDQGGNSSNVVTIKQVLDVMDKLVRVDNCVIVMDGDRFTVSGMGSYINKIMNEQGKVQGAMTLAGKLGNIQAEIQEGTLKDFEQLTGAKMRPTLSVKAKYIIELTITAKPITTVAKAPFLFDQAVAKTEEAADAYEGEYTGVAQDTYGLAMDYWVRTNAANSYLTLAGNVLTKTENVRATAKDKNGVDAELYTVKLITTITEDGQSQNFEETVEVYVLNEKENENDADGTEKEAIYNAKTHVRIAFGGVATEEGQSVSGLTPLMREVTTVYGYKGENRIWNAEDDIFMSTDSTTQGSGSCYVFYAENVAQQENSLRLLSNLRVAFVDSDEDSETYGKLVGLAKLDTENPYEENGKVTLPLVLYDDGSDYLTKTDDGLAVMKLEQNVATQLLTLVYLDGRDISNADVFAAGDIQGQLNIQFGSTMELEPIEDEDLASQTRTITAVAKKSAAAEYGSNADPITFDFDTETNPMSVDVKVTVEGDTPSNVAAIIMRQVNATQGSIEAVLPLNPSQTESGVFEGTHVFTGPGNYIIRTVRLDGIDYSLPADSDATTNKEYPRVEISGFGVEYAKVSYEGVNVGTGTKKILSDKKNVTADVEVKFATGQDKLPRMVQLQFVREAAGGDTLVTANMGYNSTTGTWSGTANFTASGEYVLKYIILDGQDDELDAEYQKILDITLGLKVFITNTDAADREKIWTGEPYSIPVFVEIYDESDNLIPHLDVALRYGTSASSVDAVDPPLRWNASRNRYEGHLWISHPGIHKFLGVTVSGGNELKTTTQKAPEFICRSNEPVVFLDAMPGSEEANNKGARSLAELDFEVVGGTAFRTGVRLKNAEAAALSAVFYNEEDQKEYTVNAGAPITYEDTVTGELVSDFVFDIPAGSKGNQAGKWTLKQLKLTGVTGSQKDENGYNIYHSDDNPLYIDMVPTETNDLYVRIVQVIVEAKYETGATEVAFTGGFMESKTTSPITFTIKDHNGAKIADEGSVSLQYKLKYGSWTTYGGYTAAHLEKTDASDVDIPVDALTSSDGVNFTLNAVQLPYAGRYVPVLTYSVNGKAVTPLKDQPALNVGLPAFTYTTSKPTVTIEAITPTSTYSVDTEGKVEDTYQRVYSHTADKSNCDKTQVDYYDITWQNPIAHQSNHTPSISADKHTATVYFQCVHDDDKTYDGGQDTTSNSPTTDRKYHAYYSDSVSGAPTVAIKLDGISGFTSATLNFSDNTHIYTGVTYSGSGLNGTWTTTGGGATYSWGSSGGTVTRNIGYVWSQKSRWSDEINATGTKTAAGTITAETLSVEQGGKTYTFKIPTITINNPY